MPEKHVVALSGFGSQSSVARAPPVKDFFDCAVNKEVPDQKVIVASSASKAFIELKADPLETERLKNFILLPLCMTAAFLLSHSMAPEDLSVIDIASSSSISAAPVDYPDFDPYTISKALARVLKCLWCYMKGEPHPPSFGLSTSPATLKWCDKLHSEIRCPATFSVPNASTVSGPESDVLKSLSSSMLQTTMSLEHQHLAAQEPKKKHKHAKIEQFLKHVMLNAST